MNFDGTLGKEGAGIGIWIRSPVGNSDGFPASVRECSYKLAFDCSNNEAEYEALITRHNILKKLGAR